MSVTLKIKGPKKSVATLSTQQAEATEDIVVDMMNRKISLKKAESQIAERCCALGMPLEFKENRA